MKYLLVLLVLLVAYQLWRAARRRSADQETAPTQAQANPPALPPREMVRCTVCALHLPRPDALSGASGRLYCSHEHRAAGGD